MSTLNIITADVFSKPLSNYACLKITRIVPSEDDGEHIPYVLHRLVSREYHVGEEGVVIGKGEDCAVKLPSESEVEDKHVEIRWVPGTLPSKR